jgi:FlaG/FlaF family flagellin (archaellin)
MSSTLILILVVVLAAVVASIFLGYIPVLQKPTLTAFSVSAVNDPSTMKTMAISLLPVAGDSLNASTGSTQSLGGKTIKNMNINLIDPSGTMRNVTLCASMPASTTFKPGNAMYIFKRQQSNYYMANSTTASSCGGGTGGGSGSGSQTNLQFTSGIWRVIIADTLSSNTVVYDGTVRL